MIERILVPLDGSSLAECALPHAAVAARAFGASILLVRVLGDPATGRVRVLGSYEWRLTRAEATEYLRQLKEAPLLAGLGVETATVVGRASEQILKLAQEQRIGLIALTSHGMGGLTEFHLSGTASKVVSNASASLLLVPPQPGGRGREEARYRRLVVPVDCSKRADWAGCLAASIARVHDAELVLVHVVPTPDVVTEAGNAPAAVKLAAELTQMNRGNARAHLEALTASLATAGLRVRFRLLADGDIGMTIRRAAEEEKAGLLVLSAHGRSPGAGWPYGAVASTLMSHGTTPILLLQDLPAMPRKRPGACPERQRQAAGAQ